MNRDLKEIMRQALQIPGGEQSKCREHQMLSPQRRVGLANTMPKRLAMLEWRIKERRVGVKVIKVVE